jgi:hypothetical protein
MHPASILGIIGASVDLAKLAVTGVHSIYDLKQFIDFSLSLLKIWAR